jgi:hypothetical protein
MLFLNLNLSLQWGSEYSLSGRAGLVLFRLRLVVLVVPEEGCVIVAV